MKKICLALIIFFLYSQNLYANNCDSSNNSESFALFQKNHFALDQDELVGSLSFHKQQSNITGTKLRDDHYLNQLLNKHDQFCSIFSSCGELANWQLGKSANAYHRKLGIYQVINYLRNKTPGFILAPDDEISWEKIAEVLEHYGSGHYNSTNFDTVSKIVNAINHEKQGQWKMQVGQLGICLKVLTPDCPAKVERIVELMSPVSLKPESIDGNKLGLEVFLGFPVELKNFTMDIRYLKALQKMNKLLLSRIILLEKDPNQNANPFDKDVSLESDLKQVIREAFNCESASCLDQKFYTVMAIYGLRGASVLSLINFFDRAHINLFIQMSLFGSMINYLDLLKHQSTSRQKIYTAPGNIFKDCLPSKPYYYWLSKVLVRKLNLEFGTDDDNMKIVYFLNLGYQILGFNRNVSKNYQEINSEENSLYYFTIRRNLAVGLLGAASEFKETQSIDLVSILDNVGDNRSPDLLAIDQPSNTTEDTYPKQALYIYRFLSKLDYQEILKSFFTRREKLSTY